MGTGKANSSGGDNERYSKIDLEDVDSWLPPEVDRFLARMIAARNRKQLEDGIDEGSCAIDLGALGVEQDDPPPSDGGHRILSGSEPLALDFVESSEVGTPEAAVLSDSQAGEETVDDGGEVNEDDFWDEGIPFF